MGNSFKKAQGMSSSSKRGKGFKDKYTLGKELGSGAFSIVRLGSSKVPIEVRQTFRDPALATPHSASLRSVTDI